MLEELPQGGVGSVQAGFHGTEAALLYFGDFLVAHAFDIAKDKQGGELGVHPRQGILDQELVFGTCHLLHWIRMMLIRCRLLKLAIPFGVADGGLDSSARSIQPSSTDIDRGVDRNAIDPRREPAAKGEVLDPAREGHHGFLCCIEGILLVADNTETDGENPVLVKNEELAVGLFKILLCGVLASLYERLIRILQGLVPGLGQDEKESGSAKHDNSKRNQGSAPVRMIHLSRYR